MAVYTRAHEDRRADLLERPGRCEAAADDVGDFVLAKTVLAEIWGRRWSFGDRRQRRCCCCQRRKGGCGVILLRVHHGGRRT